VKQHHLAASIGLILFSACTASRQTLEVSLSTEEYRSPGNFFYYRIPSGWIDATADLQSPSRHIWLLGEQHSTSIAVNEVFLEGDVKTLVESEGVTDVSELVYNLAKREQPAAGMREPSDLRVGELDCREFERYETPGDTLRVVLFLAGDRCFEVRAWKKADASLTFRDLSSAQEAFLGSLRWKPVF
jgi:hypothetical protein